MTSRLAGEGSWLFPRKDTLDCSATAAGTATMYCMCQARVWVCVSPESQGDDSSQPPHNVEPRIQLCHARPQNNRNVSQRTRSILSHSMHVLLCVNTNKYKQSLQCLYKYKHVPPCSSCSAPPQYAGVSPESHKL